MGDTNSLNNENTGLSAPSIKAFLQSLYHYWLFLRSKIWILILAAIIGAALGLFYASMKKVRYTADLSFVMEDGKSNPLASYAGLANQFGIDLGGGSGASGVMAQENILAFLQSRMMVEKTLLLPVTAAGNKKISLAELYIEVNNLREKWKKKLELANINFPATEDRSKFTRVQDSLLAVLFQQIVKTDLSVMKGEKKSGFITVSCSSPDEIFSKEFTEKLVAHAVDYYVDTKTSRSKQNIDRLQSRADSLERQLNQKTYSAAVIQDLNLNPAKKIATVQQEVTGRDKLVLQTMYGEVVKNLEISKMAMAQETPIIQVVDTPILPLEKVGKGMIKYPVIGAFLLGFLSTFLLLTFRVIKEIMTN